MESPWESCLAGVFIRGLPRWQAARRAWYLQPRSPGAPRERAPARGRRESEEAMGGLLFVTQSMLDHWADQGRIDFVGNVMTLLAGAGKGRSYALEPAARFLRVVGGEADPHGLLEKVKPLAQLRQLGAEAVGDSCILGDTAYEIEAGFLAASAAVRAAEAGAGSRFAGAAGAQARRGGGPRPLRAGAPDVSRHGPTRRAGVAGPPTAG